MEFSAIIIPSLNDDQINLCEGLSETDLLSKICKIINLLEKTGLLKNFRKVFWKREFNFSQRQIKIN